MLENAAVGNALTKDYNPIITYLPVYPLKTLVAASVTLSAVLGAIAFLAHDWMWLIIDILCIALLLLPSSKSLGYNYNRELVKMSMLAPILAVVFYLANFAFSLESEEFWEVNLYTYITAAIQAYQCFIIGMMLAVVMDKSFGLTMTIPWMVVFALTFAMSLSALDMFFTFGVLYAEGYPVFNSDFYDSDRYTNSIQMATPLTATFVTAVMAVVTIVRTRGKDKGLFILEGSE